MAAAREEAFARCDCAALTHDAFVRCAAQLWDEHIAAGDLPRSCRSKLMSCARRSVCGRPGAVVCCKRRPDGAYRASIAMDPAGCSESPSAPGCAVGAKTACDACGAGTCENARCGNGRIDAGEECDGEPFCSGCRLAVHFCCDRGDWCFGWQYTVPGVERFPSDCPGLAFGSGVGVVCDRALGACVEAAPFPVTTICSENVVTRTCTETSVQVEGALLSIPFAAALGSGPWRAVVGDCTPQGRCRARRGNLR